MVFMTPLILKFLQPFFIIHGTDIFEEFQPFILQYVPHFGVVWCFCNDQILV